MRLLPILEESSKVPAMSSEEVDGALGPKVEGTGDAGDDEDWATVEKPKASRRLAPQKPLTREVFQEVRSTAALKAKGECC